MAYSVNNGVAHVAKRSREARTPVQHARRLHITEGEMPMACISALTKHLTIIKAVASGAPRRSVMYQRLAAQ